MRGTRAFDEARDVWDSWLVTVRRRTLLKAAAGAAAVGAPLAFLFRREARADGGPLVPDPARILDLPAGYRYSILQRTFDPMSDGLKVPGRPDGMGCFAGPDGTLVLMRNHELDRSLFEAGFDAPQAPAFDARAVGGVTRVVLDEKTHEVLSSNRVLSGTLRNCAGGVSPWGWLTCEESTEPGHGYVFRCRTDATQLAPPERLTGYGRFNHEAAAVDARTFTAYLTEDRTDGCLYRYRPSDPSKPHTSGKLQALRVVSVPRFDTSRDLDHGTRLKVDWVNIPDSDPKDDTVRAQAAQLGAARFCRGEGIVMAGGHVYICCTSGGRAATGQLFRLTPSGTDAPDQLELFAESPGPGVLDMPDNICMTPWGDLLVAEDGAGEQYLRGITPDGRVYDLARNAASNGELAGVCVSPRGDAIFVNLQIDGLTLVITGPLADLSRRAKHALRARHERRNSRHRQARNRSRYGAARAFRRALRRAADRRRMARGAGGDRAGSPGSAPHLRAALCASLSFGLRCQRAHRHVPHAALAQRRVAAAARRARARPLARRRRGLRRRNGAARRLLRGRGDDRSLARHGEAPPEARLPLPRRRFDRDVARGRRKIFCGVAAQCARSLPQAARAVTPLHFAARAGWHADRGARPTLSPVLLRGAEHA